MQGKYAERQYTGDLAEALACKELWSIGFRSVQMMQSRSAPYDLEVDGQPVEVKYSAARKSLKWSLKWSFALSPKMTTVKAYVFLLNGVPGANGITFLVIPGPIIARSFLVTAESIRNEHLSFINNWSVLQAAPYPLMPRDDDYPLAGRIARITAKGYRFQDSSQSLNDVCSPIEIPASGEKKMAGKPRDIIIERGDFVPYLAARMAAFGTNVAGLAKELGISRAAMYALLSGELQPSEKILKKVGLEVVYRAVPPGREKK